MIQIGMQRNVIVNTELSDRSVLSQIADYWNRRAQGYSQQVDAELRDRLDAAYLSWFEGLMPESRVLDVGCGPGFFSVVLARRGFRVTAFDASEGMLAKACDRARAAGVQIEAVLGDAQQLPYADSSFECVCSRNLVWNLESPEEAYREWLRVLKPSGTLLIFDGNHYRYLFDERYARVHRAWEERSDHQMLGVDASIIDSIAAKLPLGRVMRPDWDVDTLAELGARASCRVLRTLTDPVSGEELVTDFVVRAEKSV